VWPRLAGGCRCDRDTRQILAEAGLDTTDVRDVRMAPMPPVAPGLVGVLRAP